VTGSREQGAGEQGSRGAGEWGVILFGVERIKGKKKGQSARSKGSDFAAIGRR